jgi:hypothetical protein
MIMTQLILNGEGVWPDLRERDFHHVKGVSAIALLEGGMKSGQASVALRIELPTGETVVAETSARIFCTAAKAFMARCPELFEEQVKQ